MLRDSSDIAPLGDWEVTAEHSSLDNFFAAVAALQHLCDAADDLHVSPPPLWPMVAHSARPNPFGFDDADVAKRGVSQRVLDECFSAITKHATRSTLLLAVCTARQLLERCIDGAAEWPEAHWAFIHRVPPAFMVLLDSKRAGGTHDGDVRLQLESALLLGYVCMWSAARWSTFVNVSTRDIATLLQRARAATNDEAARDAHVSAAAFVDVSRPQWPLTDGDGGEIVRECIAEELAKLQHGTVTPAPRIALALRFCDERYLPALTTWLRSAVSEIAILSSDALWCVAAMYESSHDAVAAVAKDVVAMLFTCDGFLQLTALVGEHVDLIAPILRLVDLRAADEDMDALNQIGETTLPVLLTRSNSSASVRLQSLRCLRRLLNVTNAADQTLLAASLFSCVQWCLARPRQAGRDKCPAVLQAPLRRPRAPLRYATSEERSVIELATTAATTRVLTETLWAVVDFCLPHSITATEGFFNALMKVVLCSREEAACEEASLNAVLHVLSADSGAALQSVAESDWAAFVRRIASPPNEFASDMHVNGTLACLLLLSLERESDVEMLLGKLSVLLLSDANQWRWTDWDETIAPQLLRSAPRLQALLLDERGEVRTATARLLELLASRQRSACALLSSGTILAFFNQVDVQVTASSGTTLDFTVIRNITAVAEKSPQTAMLVINSGLAVRVVSTTLGNGACLHRPKFFKLLAVVHRHHPEAFITALQQATSSDASAAGSSYHALAALAASDLGHPGSVGSGYCSAVLSATLAAHDDAVQHAWIPAVRVILAAFAGKTAEDLQNAAVVIEALRDSTIPDAVLVEADLVPSLDRAVKSWTPAALLTGPPSPLASVLLTLGALAQPENVRKILSLHVIETILRRLRHERDDDDDEGDAGMAAFNHHVEVRELSLCLATLCIGLQRRVGQGVLTDAARCALVEGLLATGAVSAASYLVFGTSAWHEAFALLRQCYDAAPAATHAALGEDHCASILEALSRHREVTRRAPEALDLTDDEVVVDTEGVSSR
jgi:hypothetical protein